MDAVVLRKERPIGHLLLGAGVAWRLMRMKETQLVYALTHHNIAVVTTHAHCGDANLARHAKNAKVTAQHGRRKAATRIVHGAGPGALR